MLAEKLDRAKTEVSEAAKSVERLKELAASLRETASDFNRAGLMSRLPWKAAVTDLETATVETSGLIASVGALFDSVRIEPEPFVERRRRPLSDDRKAAFLILNEVTGAVAQAAQRLQTDIEDEQLRERTIKRLVDATKEIRRAASDTLEEARETEH